MRDLERFDVNRLLALHWLLEEKSVTRAARRMAVSQPAMSRTLASLRSALGDPLLVSVGRAMTPTERALAMREPLARAVEALRAAVRAPEAFDPLATRMPLRIAANDYPGGACIAAWLKHARRRAPGIAVTVVPLTPELPRALGSGAVDLVVLPDLALKNVGAFADVTQFVQKKVTQDRFVSVMRAGHPLARRRLTREAFAALDHVLVSPTGTGEGVVDERLQRRGMSRRIAFRVPSFLLALPIVAASDCVATLPRLLVKASERDWCVRPPPVDLPPLILLCAWHPSRTSDAAHKWMRDSLIAALQAEAAQG